MSDIQEQIKLAHKRAEENDIKLLQEENERLNLIIIAIKKQCEVWEDYEMSEFIKQLENEKEISNWLKKVAGVDKE